MAENGRDAVDRAIKENLDFILMDVQMPILDGNAAVNELTTADYKTPLVALTAYAVAEEHAFSIA